MGRTRNAIQSKITKNKTIVLPINEAKYEAFLREKSLARELIEKIYKTH